MLEDRHITTCWFIIPFKKGYLTVIITAHKIEAVYPFCTFAKYNILNYCISK